MPPSAPLAGPDLAVPELVNQEPVTPELVTPELVTPELAGSEPRDAAWVAIDTPLAPAELLAFLDDVERLYRINPLYEMESFSPLGGDRYRLTLSNHADGRKTDTEIRVARRADGIDVHYGFGLKSKTTFRVEATGAAEGPSTRSPARGPSRLVVTDIYEGAPVDERAERLDEVDRSLNAWGRALHDYLARWARWGRLAPWRWYMERVWMPMTPSGRRIVYMILVVSAFEVVALLAIAVVLLLARAHG